MAGPESVEVHPPQEQAKWPPSSFTGRCASRQAEPQIDISAMGVLFRGRGRWGVGAVALVFGLALAVLLLGVALDREWIVLLVPRRG